MRGQPLKNLIPPQVRGDTSKKALPLETAQTVKQLQVLIKKLLARELKVRGHVSTALVADLVKHWERDMERLFASQTDGLSPAKHFGYLGFWIRKIKPVSSAFPIRRGKKSANSQSLENEVVDINEKVAIYVALLLLLEYLRSKASGRSKTSKSHREEEVAARKFLQEFLRKPSEDGNGTTFDDLVYDMRYRTFGPHHITHLLNWALGRV